MKVYEKKWWQKLFKKPPQKKQQAPAHHTEAILDTISDIKKQAQQLVPQLKTLHELTIEQDVARAGVLELNLKTQAQVLNKILEQYEFLESDIVINGIRLKAVAQQLLDHADAIGLSHLAAQKRKQWKLE